MSEASRTIIKEAMIKSANTMADVVLSVARDTTKPIVHKPEELPKVTDELKMELSTPDGVKAYMQGIEPGKEGTAECDKRSNMVLAAHDGVFPSFWPDAIKELPNE